MGAAWKVNSVRCTSPRAYLHTMRTYTLPAAKLSRTAPTPWRHLNHNYLVTRVLTSRLAHAYLPIRIALYYLPTRIALSLLTDCITLECEIKTITAIAVTILDLQLQWIVWFRVRSMQWCLVSPMILLLLYHRVRTPTLVSTAQKRLRAFKHEHCCFCYYNNVNNTN